MNFHIKTYGCKLNQADSEIIKGFLFKKHKETSREDADFVILNTCGVIEKTERKILKEAEDLRRKGKKVIIAGCLPVISLEKCEEVADGIIGPSNLSSISAVIEKAMQGEKLIKIEKENIDKSFYWQENKGHSLIVPIAEGCLGNCSYCATKIARKNLVSFSSEKIVEKIKSSKVKEIQLTSQDLSVYGMEKGNQGLVPLLKEVVKIERDFKIKLGMMNPGYTIKMMDELLDIFESDKVYKFIHLPLQSGSNDLLKKMNRTYLSEDFIKISESFRKRFKETIIATDIIVGHPLETEGDFEKTVKVLKKIKPEVVHIFKFSRRKGTEDFLLRDLPDRIKKDRSRVLTSLCQEINLERNKKYLNKSLEVLVVDEKKNNYLARTNSGRAVILKKGEIGQHYKVKIIDYRWNYLIGKI
jgi:MiaB-like tRNA modifying enzyme